MMHVPLIFPMVAAICRLDTSTTEAAAGYDPRFKSVKTSYPAGPDKPRVRGRRELPEIRVRCQVEKFTADKQQQGPGGDLPDWRFHLVFHFRDLEKANLVDADGKALIHVNDRLAGMYRGNAVGEDVLIRLYTKPELFATEVRDQDFGIGLKRNLLIVTFEERPQGLTAAQS